MKQLVSFVCVGIVSVLLASCSPKPADMQNQNEEPPVADRGDTLLPESGQQIELQRVNRREVPEPVARWIDRCSRFSVTAFTDTKEYGEFTYIFVARGERPTGGYSVEIVEANRKDDDQIDVRVRFTRPPPDAMVTQAISYPMDIAAIRAKNVTVNIVPEGNDRPGRITRLRGIESLKEIKSSSRSIKLFTPAPDTETNREISVSGVAFNPEGYIQYKLIDHTGVVKKSGEISISTPLEWGHFETHIQVPEDFSSGSKLELVLFRFDEERQREEDRVTISLTIR